MLRWLVLLFVTMGLVPSSAEACLCPGGSVAAPFESESHVPLDVRHLYIGDRVEGTYRLVGPSGSVPLQVEVLGTQTRSFVRLVVPSELEPQTMYEVWLNDQLPQERRVTWFVTGEAGDREPPLAPVFGEIKLGILEQEPNSTCSTTRLVSGSLEATSDTRWIHLRFSSSTDSFERVLPPAEPTTDNRWYLDWLRGGGCALDLPLMAGETYTIEARTVDLAGNESEPARIDVLVTEPPADGGCSSSKPTSTLFLGLALCALRRGARRRTTSARAR